MKKSTLLLLFVYCGLQGIAQVKIGNNPNQITNGALLELESTNKGLLLPRISLSSSQTASPLVSHINGMIVFNIATTNDVTPGMYLNDGIQWVRITTGIPISVNVYTADGTITENRTINIGTNVFSVAGTSAIKLPVGTSAERPATPTVGMMRFNSTTNKLEGYDGTNWVDLN